MLQRLANTGEGQGDEELSFDGLEVPGDVSWAVVHRAKGGLELKIEIWGFQSRESLGRWTGPERQETLLFKWSRARKGN